jgi:hypothetical protein
MTDENARKVANVILGAAALGAAFYIVRTPPLRRIAWRLAVAAVTGTIPAWLAREVREAWTESGRRAL